MQSDPHGYSPTPHSPRATARPLNVISAFGVQSGKFPRIAHSACAVGAGGGCRLKAGRLVGNVSILGLIVYSLQPTVCLAADTYTPPPAFDSWLANSFYVVALVTALVALWKMLFPQRKPAIETEFVSKADLLAHCAVRHGELERSRQDLREQICGVSSRIEKMRLELTAAIEAHNQTDEARAKDMHQRINPISEGLSGVRSQIDNHLQDHRSRKT